MKVTMVNDCAYVGETLLKYLSAEIETQHLKRSRGWWSKTFGIAWSILKAEADVYHVHYLLQDCYLASRFGKKPLVGHAHGSDVRSGLKHPIWRRIVRHNLKHCNSILVSTPDIIPPAREVREDAKYLPNPVDHKLFYPKPPNPSRGKIKVLIASDANWTVKGTDIAIRALSKIRDKVEVNIIRCGVDFDRTMALAGSLGLRLNVLPMAPHEKLNQYYWNVDVVIDRFKLGSLGLVSLESIACGRPTISHVSSEYPENRDFPMRDLETEEEIAQTISDLPSKLWEKEFLFFKKYHDTKKITSQVLAVYKEIAEQSTRG